MNYPGIPAPYYIGSTLVHLTPTPLRPPQPEAPWIDMQDFEVPERWEWTAADEFDARCDSMHRANQYRS